ncbi:signal peptidase II [Oceanobacillus sp. 1P07AA]|uniref:signal peptidase II n=1 Tax=Oceanobacillus sp. 1P07AA TaxID=3132293 RepID=UPI0039A5EFBE
MIIYYLIAIVLVIVDQFTKWLIVSRMELGESIPVIDNFFYITSHRNTGAAWGILEGQMLLFYIITTVVIISIIYFLHTYVKGDRLLSVALAIILGGAIGNFIDRIFRQEVVDFANFYIFNYNFPIFNVADSALTIGVIIFLIATILEEKRQKGKSKS